MSAAKLLLTAPLVALLVLASTGVLPSWSIALWAAALLALTWRFRRWEADDVARRPHAPVGGAAPQAGEVVRYAPWSSRVLVTTLPAVGGTVAVTLLLLSAIPAWRLLAAPLTIGLAWYVWRGLHLGLELRWDEVTVSNPLRTYRSAGAR